MKNNCENAVKEKQENNSLTIKRNRKTLVRILNSILTTRKVYFLKKMCVFAVEKMNSEERFKKFLKEVCAINNVRVCCESIGEKKHLMPSR